VADAAKEPSMGSRGEIVITSLTVIFLAGLTAGRQDAIGEGGADPATVFRGLKSRDLKVRHAAVESLVNLALSREGDRAVREDLKMLAQIVENKEEDAEIRGQVVRAIAMVSERKRVDQGIVPRLIKVLLDEKEKEIVRSWIAMSLPDLAPPEVAGPPTLAASRSANKNVRVNAAQQLGRVRLDPDKVIPWLKQAIKDPDASVRVAAVGTAAELSRRDRRALEVFVRGLADRDQMVRGVAVGLVRHGNILGTEAEDGRTAVERLLKDPAPRVAVGAAAALMKMTPKGAEKYLAILIRPPGRQGGGARGSGASAGAERP
jgi:HEAT repeat protein